MMADVDVDVICVTAYKCVHCDALFSNLDTSLEHLDTCPARTAFKKKLYVEDSMFGNMILKEAANP